MNERSFNPSAEIRAQETKQGNGTITGYAVVYNSLSEVMYTRSGRAFREKVAPGAFAAHLKSGEPIKAYVQHNGGLHTIGSTENGTLELTDTPQGLRFSIALPDTQAAKDIYNLVRDGYVNKCSFGFRLNPDNPDADSWEIDGDMPIRTLLDAEIGELSIVDTPAYRATVAEARSMDIPEVDVKIPEQRAIVEQDENVLRISIFGNIVNSVFMELMGVEPESSGSDIMKILRDAGGYDTIEVVLNSPGGDAFEGTAIYNRLRNMAEEKGVKIRTRVEGLAASAAATVFLAGDERIVHDGALIMIHRASGLTFGNAEDHRRTAGLLSQIDETEIDLISKRTGQSVETIAAMVNDETWMNSAKASELGFATMVSEKKANIPEEIEERCKRMNYRNAPAHLKGETRAGRTLDPKDVLEYARMRLDRLTRK